MTTWTDAPLVALDLEGSGAHDRDDEAILEIVVVPIYGGQPFLPDAFAALINPGRPDPPDAHGYHRAWPAVFSLARPCWPR